MNATADPAATATRPAATREPRQRHVVLRHRLSVDGVGAPVLAAVFFLAVMAVVTMVSLVRDVEISGWETATQVVRWFVGAMGVYLSAVYLPLYVTHGVTRREAATDTACFAVVYALIVGALLALGYALEGVVYRIAGWTQGLSDPHLFEAADQFHLVLAQYVAVAPVWLLGGAMLGAAFYRNGLLGLVLIPVALSAVVTVEVVAGPGYVGPVPPPLIDAVGLDLGMLSAWGALAVSAVASVVLGAVTWVIVRDVPIRPQAS